jgi:hypothetical protein
MAGTSQMLLLFHGLYDLAQPGDRRADNAGMSSIGFPLAATSADRTAIAIDRHVTATSATLARVLAATIDSLDEPRAANPELALHHLGYLVETLLGVAVGGVVGRIVSAVLRSLGSDVGYRLELRLREALLCIGPGSETSLTGAPAPAPSSFAKAATSRRLVDELGTRLRPRLAHASRAHRAVLARIASAVPAARTLAFTSSLALLEDDPMLSRIWSEHLTVAWRYYAFAVTNARDGEPELPPELARGTSRDTWRAWLQRVRGEAEPAAPHRNDYIMTVLG